MFESMIIAFSMYSKIPMPHIEWNKKNMKYAMAFFPFVGLAIGLCFILWSYLWNLLGMSKVLFAAITSVLPVVITGGIHIDGFCDTIDAKSSHQSIDKKLEILKDPHIGAFAMIYTIVYFIVSFGFLYELEINISNVVVLALGYVLSRSFSALAIVTFKCAKNSGLAYMFSDGAEKRNVRNIMVIYIVISSLIMIALSPILGISMIIISILSFIYYRVMSYKEFNGITGDLAGYFLQVTELLYIVTAVIVGGLL